MKTLNGEMTMKRIINYPGSKWSLAKEIIKLFPPHKSYLEPFAGSLAVFFQKEKAILETINDLDGRLINLFRQMRENPQELARLVALTPYARKEYDISCEQSDDELEDSRRMMVRLWFGIGGKTVGKTGFRRNVSWNGPYNTCDWQNIPPRILEAAQRLRDAQIENKPAVQLIREMNDKDTLIYADPPYLHETRTSRYYHHEMNKKQHIELLEALKGFRGSVILSGYESKLYDEHLQDWYKVTFQSRTLSGKAKSEVLWLNYEPNGQTTIFDRHNGLM
jgi:DNA adenine methylase